MHRKVLIALSAVAAVLLVLTAGVLAYDQSAKETIAQGVSVGGVDVGGMEADAARARLRFELLEPLAAPVTVRAGKRRFRLTAREARVAVNVDAGVAEALERSRAGDPFSRAFRGLTGRTLVAEVDPSVTFSSEAVGRLVSRVKRRTDRAPRDARVDFAATGLDKVAARSGVEVDRRDLRDRVEAALVEPLAVNRRVRARTTRIRPKVTSDELEERYGTVVTVDRGGFRLRLFKKLKLVESYDIAVGKVGLETPSGVYSVQNKAVNPAWNVPDSDWAGDLAGQVIPGGAPNNPLKARWLGIYNGVGIHGTDARGSIGTNASHGCIRMLVEDVTELYDRVPTGASVYIA